MKNILKKLSKKRMMILLLCAVLVAGAAAGQLWNYSYSKYTEKDTVEGVDELQEFYAAAKLYIKNTDGTIDHELPLTEDKDSEGNVIRRYFAVPFDDFEKMAMDITYQGRAKVYMRFNFTASFYHKSEDEDGNEYDELLFRKIPEFTFDDSVEMFDNREKDRYIYFKNVIEFDDEEEQTIHVITKAKDMGGITDPNDQEKDQPEFVRIYVTIDCVQYNRALALWNMNQFPWES